MANRSLTSIRGRQKTPPTSPVLTEDEARRIAANIANLPTLLGIAPPDDAVNNLSDERHAAEDTTPKDEP